METFDVIIVGAGPGGCSAASRLVGNPRRPIRALILERLDQTGFQRYHRMCAEGLSAGGMQEVPANGDDLILNRITKVREHWPGGTIIDAPVTGFIIDRGAMLRRARGAFVKGGGIIENDGVVEVARQEGSFRVACRSGKEYASRYLIGADGAHSIVRRSIFEGSPAVLMPVEQYIVDSAPSDPERMDFVFDQRYQGKYRWTFPSGNRTKIGFPAGSDNPPGEYVEHHARTIPVGPVAEFVSGNACLIGDAAGQANPVTFGGIRNALTAGRMAAFAIANGDLGLYESMWRSSGLADPVFMEAFRLIRGMGNDRLAAVVEPYRHGFNPFAVMRGLMGDSEFAVLHRAHVLKLGDGW
jgi:digeranylgeranylglycerophospholipid reductase